MTASRSWIAELQQAKHSHGPSGRIGRMVASDVARIGASGIANEQQNLCATDGFLPTSEAGRIGRSSAPVISLHIP